MSATRFEFTNRARPILEVGLGSSTIDESAALWDVSLWDAVGSQWNGDEPLWRDVACDTIEAHIEIGRGRVADAFPVGTADIVVDNDSGWADPSVEPDQSVGYFGLTGLDGDYVSVADYAALGVTGDICIVFRFRTAQWPPASNIQIAAKDGAWIIFVTTLGILQLWTAQGAVISISQSDFISPSTDWRWYAVVLDVNNGAAGHDHKWFYGGNGENQGAWVEIESGTTAGVIAINDTADPLVIGTVTALNSLDGEVSHLSVRSGFGPGLTVGGTTVFEFNGWDLTEADVDATSITPRVGSNPMVVHGDVEVVAAINPFQAILRLRPGRPIRIGVHHDTLGDKWLFRGFIDSIEPVDDPEDWSTVRMRCIDALGEAGRAKLSAETETGEDEESRTRFSRILNLIRWPASKRSINASAVRPLYAAEMSGQVIDLLRQTAESEGGWAYADNNGNIVLQNRDWLYHETTEDVDATIGNIGVDDVCPGRWIRTFDRADIATQVIFGNDYPSTEVSPLEPVVVNDFPSQNLYGLEVFERLDLWTKNRTTLIQNAGRVLGTRSAGQSMPLIRSVTLDAGMSDDVLDVMAALSIYTPSRYRCRLQKNGRVVFNGIFFAIGVTHDLSADAWTANVSLDRAGTYAVLDPADYIWDTARWDHSLWN